MNPGSHQSRRRGLLTAWAALAVLCAVVYANTLGNDFVLDDTSYIRDNYLLRDLGNLPLFFNVPPDAVVEDLPAGFLRGRNLRWVTYAADYAIGGGSPLVFHLSNIFWHLFAGSCLLLLLCRWFGSILPAFLAAAVFLAHPIQTGAVAYISGRKDLLATGFLLLTLLMLERFREAAKVRWLVAGGACFFVAFFSKEVAVVLPVLLFWSDLCRDRSGGLAASIKNLLRTQWKEYLFFAVLTAVFVGHLLGPGLFSRLVAESPAVASAAGIAEGPNLSWANLVGFYFWKLLWPANLLADYKDVFDFSLYPPAQGIWWSSLLAAALVIALVCLRRRWAAGAVGLGWVVVALLPVSHLIDFHYPVAEHYLYLPCAGFALAVGSGVGRLLDRFGNWALILPVLLVIVYGGVTARRNLDWRNMETLTLDILAKAPRHPRARSTLVHLYMQQGRQQEALQQALETLEEFPGSAINHYNLGVLYYDLGELERAEHHYREAIALHPTLWDAYLNLGNMLLVHGRRAEGIKVIDGLFRGYGYHPLAFWVLGNDQARQGDWAGALVTYRKALAVDPQGAAGQLGVAGSLWSLGKVAEAQIELGRALKAGLDLDWACNHEPWKTFLRRPEVAVFLSEFNKR